MAATVGLRTLAIDVGATHVKAAVLDEQGALVTERVRMDSPVHAAPEGFVEAIVQLVAALAPFDRVSVGFCGFVRDGTVRTAPNLGSRMWEGFGLASVLADRLHAPVRVGNDADVQGLGVIAGKGLEMVITLGTGFGTGLYRDGRLAPHLEIAHQPFRKGETYDEQLGEATRRRVGNPTWKKRVRRAVRNMRSLTSFDHLYIGGGNAKRVALESAPDVTIVSNLAGLIGGIGLWRDP